METAITPFVPAAKALPVCGYVPPGGCVVYQSDCAPYPPNTPFCPAPGVPYAVPIDGGVMLALVVLLLVIVGVAAARSK